MKLNSGFLRSREFCSSANSALFDEQAGRWISYGELEARVTKASAQFAGHLRGLAFLLCPVRPATVIAYLALVRAGHVVALIDPQVSAATLSRLLDVYQPEWLVTPQGEESEVQKLDQGLFVSVRPSAAAPPLHPELAVLLSTSGSTGSPKFARLSRAALEANAAAIATSLDLTADERALAYQNLHYAYGLSVVNSHLHAGGSLLLTTKTVLERSFWEQAAHENCTSFSGVPYTYQMLRRFGPTFWDFLSLRTMTQAGGRLKPELVAWFHDILATRGKRFVPMYGQTEATARITIMPSGALPAKLGSVGCAIPGGRLEIASSEGAREGEIIYSGASVMMGYAESRADLSRGDECHGRLLTGDVGYTDADGFLYVTGRIRRIAKLFGLRVNLDEVEARLQSLGAVAAIESRDRLLVFGEFRDTARLQERARELAADLKLHHSAVRLQAVEALPLLASGKVDYQRLREEA